jgi:vancomycin aglycone glucosyltransferase
MRVLLSTYGSRGDVEPMVGLAVQSRALGAEIRVCAPPDEEFAELLAGGGVSLVPVGQPVRPPATRAMPPSAADLPRRAAEEFDAPVATGVMPTGVWR